MQVSDPWSQTLNSRLTSHCSLESFSLAKPYTDVDSLTCVQPGTSICQREIYRYKNWRLIVSITSICTIAPHHCLCQPKQCLRVTETNPKQIKRRQKSTFKNHLSFHGNFHELRGVTKAGSPAGSEECLMAPCKALFFSLSSPPFHQPPCPPRLCSAHRESLIPT